MSNVFVFDPAAFKLAYPQFAKFTDEQLNYFFETVENRIIDNTESSCISLANRKIWFYLLVAHKGVLQNRIDDGGGEQVGRTSSATEGSISVTMDYNMGSGAMEQWLNQTAYGAEFSALSSAWRKALWVSADHPMPVNRARLRFPFGGWFI